MLNQPLSSWVSLLARGMALLLGAGASCGMAVWALVYRHAMVRFVQSNQIEAMIRKLAFVFVAGGLTFPLVAVVVYLVVRRKHLDQAAARVESVGWTLAPLCLAALLPLMFQWKIWKGHDINFLVFVAITTFSLQKLLFRSLDQPAWTDRRMVRLAAWFRGVGRAFERSSRWLPWVIVVGLFLFYASYFSFFTVRNHWNLRTAAYDMAIEDNVVYNAMFGKLLKASPMFGPKGTHLGHHATFFAYLLVPFYALSPRAETLLVLQAVLMAGAIFPLFLFARHRLGPYRAVALAAMFVLYAPLHGANLYDFHYPPLGIGFVFWVAFLVDTGRNKLAVIPLLLALSVREDMALAIFALGVYFLLSKVKPRAGLALAAIGAVYFVTMKMGVMPAIRHGKTSFAWYYKKLIPKDGPSGFSGILTTIIGNPGYTLDTLLTKEKIQYFLQIMVPFAFLPFRRGVGFVFCLPGLLMTLLATRKASYDIAFQYTTHWVIGLFLAVVAIMTMIHKPAHEGDTRGPVRVNAWLLAMVVAMVANSYQHGAILQRNTVKGGFWKFKFDRSAKDIERYQQMDKLRAQIPPKAIVAGSSHLLPQVSNRPNAYTLRTVGVKNADYLFFSIKMGGREKKRVHPMLRDDVFGVVDVAGEFVLAKRGHSTERNAEVLK